MTPVWDFHPKSGVVEIREVEVDMWNSKCPSPAINLSEEPRAEEEYIRISPTPSAITMNPSIDVIYPVFSEPQLLQHLVADIRLLALDSYWLVIWWEQQRLYNGNLSFAISKPRCHIRCFEYEVRRQAYG